MFDEPSGEENSMDESAMKALKAELNTAAKEFIEELKEAGDQQLRKSGDRVGELTQSVIGGELSHSDYEDFMLVESHILATEAAATGIERARSLRSAALKVAGLALNVFL